MSGKEPKRRVGRPQREMPQPLKGVSARTLANRVLNSPRRRPGEWRFLGGGQEPEVDPALDSTQWSSCAGCGGTESAVWHRAKDEDGRTVYVCHDCFEQLQAL